MRKLVDVSPGMKFGRLTAIRETGKDKHGHSIWLFRCECGNEKEIARYLAVSGKTKSCGCLNVENLAAGNNRRTHGMSGSRLNRIWKAMKARCNAPEGSRNFKWYCNVSVCSEWSDFSVFQDWALANGYRDDLSIDRINPHGNYEPSNCRWATAKEQANNKRIRGKQS